MTSYFESLTDSDREALFTYMRRLDEKGQHYWRQARTLTAPAGTIPVGAAAFDPTIRALAGDAYLRGLRAGLSPDAAYTEALDESRASVKLHNAKRPREMTWQRDPSSAEPFLLGLFHSTPLPMPYDG